jgi:hypothetical protein
MNTADTAAHTPAGTPAAAPNAIPADTADSLARLMDGIEAAIGEGAPVDVLLYRVSAGGREPVARLTGDEFDPFTLAAAYGPGRYFARLRVAGQWRGSATFVASAAATPAAPPPRWPAAPAAAAAPAADAISPMALFSALMAQQQAAAQQQTAILTALINRDSGGLKAADLIALLSKRSEVGELVEGMRALSELAPDSSSPRGGGDDLGSILSALAPALAAAAAQPSPALSPRGVARGASGPAAPARRLPNPPRPGGGEFRTRAAGPAPISPPAAAPTPHAPPPVVTPTTAPSADVGGLAGTEAHVARLTGAGFDSDSARFVARLGAAAAGMHAANLAPSAAAAALFVELADSLFVDPLCDVIDVSGSANIGAVLAPPGALTGLDDPNFAWWIRLADVLKERVAVDLAPDDDADDDADPDDPAARAEAAIDAADKEGGAA